MTIRDKYNSVHRYGQDGCGELEISVKLEFECNYFLHALSALRDMLKDVESYEIRYDCDNSKVVVLVFPHDIKIINELKEVKDIDCLEEVW